MQDINLHIEYLLRYHDCVIVPGIGAFLRSRRPACMIEETGALIPARTEVCFNSSITSDDGLLAHSISRREEIGFEQARIELGYYSEAIRSSLAADGEIAIGRIGTLNMDSNGVLSFTPRKATMFIGAPILPPDTKTDQTEKQETVHSPYYVFRIPRRVVRYAAMLSIVLMTCMSLSVPVTDTHRVDKASVLPLPVETTIENTQATEPLQSEQTITENRYYLIVGASRSLDKCNKFIAQHPTVPLTILRAGNNNLIYIEASDCRENLLTLMRSTEITDEFGQTWIYDKDN